MISLCEHRNGDIPFRNRLFPEKIGYDVKIINVLAFIEYEEKFSKVSVEDAIRLCVLLSLEVIFIGRELVFIVDDAFLRMVNDLDAWNSPSWGEHIWRQLYDSIRNVCSKHKLEHLDGLRKNPNHVPSYTLFGFLFAFKGTSNLENNEATLSGKVRLLDNDGNPLLPTDIVESDREAEVLYDETANLVIPTSGSDRSDKGYGINSLLKQWRDSYPDNDEYDPYDDDMYENYDLSEQLQSMCDDLDITIRSKKKK
nr:phospholipase-like, aminotransferase-like mobile domain protein [Tanacetum cinerariifolium]